MPTKNPLKKYDNIKYDNIRRKYEFFGEYYSILNYNKGY